MNRSSLLLALLTIFHLAYARDDIVLHITSLVPNDPPLQFLCHLKDFDFGPYSLSKDQERQMKLAPTNITDAVTLFCNFTWGHKVKNFAVYDKNINAYCEGSYDCYWEARPDGFYLSKNNSTWKKFNTWT
ncbi:hypothetical protein RHGRI_026043 [Rhododendron griersonianum]|uniref:S-protein homolog n=1 Tax=Rhododendron griersonianum TaxID=479676 RepID=A0AAV6IR84_9ERIC|nr:hypothetical protein RHGRI_026043 [Rhododendron griersonianum]